MALKPIAEYMWKFMNTWENKPVQFSMNALDKEGPAMMIQPLSGGSIDRPYVDGSFRASWPFAVYIRIKAQETRKRLDAIQVLDAMTNWMKETDLPDLGENRIATQLVNTALPSLVAIYEDGGEDYQAIFSLKYREKKGVDNNA